MGFFSRFWKSGKNRKSVFGGSVQSQEEIEKLNSKIVSHEEREALQAEKDLEEAQKHLWEK